MNKIRNKLDSENKKEDYLSSYSSFPYEKKKTKKGKDSILESLTDFQGKIFSEYFENRDEERFYYRLRELLKNILDTHEELSPREKKIADTMFHYVDEIEKILESRSRELL